MLICFHAPSPLVYFGLFRINTMAHTLGMSIQQHQQKSLLKFYVLPRAKKEPLSRKILGKAVQNAVGKGTGPSNLPDTAVGIFLSRLKKWAQKSPEVVETSRLFAAASFLVQLDGGPEETRTLDLSDANRTLSRTVHNYAPKQGIFIVKISKITGNQCVCPFSYKTLFPLPVSVRECLLYFQGAFGDVTQMAGK